MPRSRNEIDFLFELRVLLDRYDVDIVAVDDGVPGDASSVCYPPICRWTLRDGIE
ncbi:MAG: hypothetical protein QGF59_10410 [Pirellulaceae bacterium]|jgi:hypothetical protein|nr:hypothetical protein [Pirellulaceae bacterium]